MTEVEANDTIEGDLAALSSSSTRHRVEHLHALEASLSTGGNQIISKSSSHASPCTDMWQILIQGSFPMSFKPCSEHVPIIPTEIRGELYNDAYGQFLDQE